jgi:Ca-activated chloride channel homolog
VVFFQQATAPWGVAVKREILIIGLVMALRALPAQLPAVEPSGQPFKLSVTAELVLLDVSAKSAKGEHISGLTKDSFRVYEDGKLQTVSHFASEDVPVTAGVVIDSSGSMRSKRAEVVSAALSFIGASNRRDEMFVVHFSDGVRLGLPPGIPFSDDVNQLSSALWRGASEGMTALNDAIVFSLKHLDRGRRDRRILVLVSDGGDNSSVHDNDEVKRTVLESRATIYAIGLFDEAGPDSNPGLLRRLARMSGGEAFLEVELPAVGDVCRKIAADIRARYTIGYVPVRSNERHALRKIHVTATAPGGRKLVVHTREGYLLPPRVPLKERDGKPDSKGGL